MPVAGPSFPVTTRIKSSLKLPPGDSFRHQTQNVLGLLCLLGLCCQFFMDLNGAIHVLGLQLNEPRQSNLQNRQDWNVNTPNPNKNQKMVICSKTWGLTQLKREKGKQHTSVLSLWEQWLQLLYSLLNWYLKWNRYEELQLRYCISNCSTLENIRIWCR